MPRKFAAQAALLEMTMMKAFLLVFFLGGVVQAGGPIDPTAVAKAVAEEDQESRKRQAEAIAAKLAAQEKQIMALSQEPKVASGPPAGTPLCFMAPDGSLSGCLVWRKKGKRWVLDFSGDTSKSARAFFVQLQRQSAAYLTLACPATGDK